MNKKIVILIGIAVCAMLLATPVLASAGYSKIYGNANEDDVLDMRDVTYIKLVIFGKKPETKLADANYDGKISMLDIGQTKLIILDKEKQLTFVDMGDRTVTIPRPIERTVSLFTTPTRLMVAFGAADKLVGMGRSSHTYVYTPYSKAFPEEIPMVGTSSNPNFELILSLTPNVAFMYSGRKDLDAFQEKTGIPVAGFSAGATYDNVLGQFELMGTVLGNEKRAEEIVAYFNEKLDKITRVTSQIHDSEKPRVLFVVGSITRASGPYEPIDTAGGINVAGELIQPPGAGGITVSKEQVIAWNPDIILVSRTSKTQKCTIEDVLSDSDLQTINAVKNKSVYYTPSAFFLVGADYPRILTEILIMASYFHPDKFKDLDLEREGNEIFERFYGVDGLWTELGTELGFI